MCTIGDRCANREREPMTECVFEALEQKQAFRSVRQVGRARITFIANSGVAVVYGDSLETNENASFIKATLKER
jgi:hypothetical protein